MVFLLVLFASLGFASFFGHVIHWMIHQRWTGPLHSAHMDHHLEQYPPDDLLSPTYRYAKWYHSGPLLFTPPLVLIMGAALGALWMLSTPVWVLVTFAVANVTFGLLNDYVHDAFHLSPYWLERYELFRRLRVVHFEHHFNMKRNYGIFFFAWDRVFGTYKYR